MKLNYLRVRLREHFVNPQLLKQLAVYKIKEEHLTDDCKLIDAALKYGYDSPDSFTKAFTRFHGITPVQAKLGEGELKEFLPLKLHISIKGVV